VLWHQFDDINQLKSIIEQSNLGLTVLIFKHSTRCSISSMALNRLESKWIDNENIQTYFLDLLRYRNISNEISSVFAVQHASPQILLIKNGRCIYNASHTDISASDILMHINK